MELYYTRTLSNRKSICISALTDEQLSDSGALERFGGIGYFLYEREILDGEEEIEVLAHLPTDEAAEKLAQIIEASDPRPTGPVASIRPNDGKPGVLLRWQSP